MGRELCFISAPHLWTVMESQGGGSGGCRANDVQASHTTIQSSNPICGLECQEKT